MAAPLVYAVGAAIVFGLGWLGYDAYKKPDDSKAKADAEAARLRAEAAAKAQQAKNDADTRNAAAEAARKAQEALAAAQASLANAASNIPVSASGAPVYVPVGTPWEVPDDVPLNMPAPRGDRSGAIPGMADVPNPMVVTPDIFDQIKNVQMALMLIGYDIGTNGTADGRFTDGTKQAIRQFQADNNVNDEGWGQQSKIALAQACNQQGITTTAFQ